jgi:hypothetical protein
MNRTMCVGSVVRGFPSDNADRVAERVTPSATGHDVLR